MLRPSSAPVAKASTVCSSKLDHIHEYESRPDASPRKEVRRRDMTNGFGCPRKGSVKTLFPIRAPEGTRIKDARVHCVVLNIRSALPRPGHPVGRSPRKPARHVPAPRPIPQDPTACTSPYWTAIRVPDPRRSRTGSITGLPATNRRCSTLERSTPAGPRSR